MPSIVQYLEHVVSKKGIQVDFEKVRVVAQWPVPSCQQEIKKFLGFASYYRRFVPNFARVATPLYRLCEQNRAWLWDAECERAFCSLKQLLTSAPILMFPHFDHPFIHDVDASATGVGAVLSQVIDGHEWAVAYASRALTKPERWYCTPGKKCWLLCGQLSILEPTCMDGHFKQELIISCLSG